MRARLSMLTDCENWNMEMSRTMQGKHVKNHLLPGAGCYGRQEAAVGLPGPRYNQDPVKFINPKI